MFNFRKLIQAVGISLLITIMFGFINGLFEIFNVEWSIIMTFLVSYISIGILAPYYNRKTPYTAAFLGSIIVTLSNFLFSVYVMRLPVFSLPKLVSDNLLMSTTMAMITAIIFVAIMKRKERVAYD